MYSGKCVFSPSRNEAEVFKKTSQDYLDRPQRNVSGVRILGILSSDTQYCQGKERSLTVAIRAHLLLLLSICTAGKKIKTCLCFDSNTRIGNRRAFCKKKTKKKQVQVFISLFRHTDSDMELGFYG